jgi:hypothetical protein
VVKLYTLRCLVHGKYPSAPVKKRLMDGIEKGKTFAVVEIGSPNSQP